MQWCTRCKVFVKNPQRCCPLCQGRLDGLPHKSDVCFPDLKERSTKAALWFRIFSFVCIAVAVISLSGNWVMGFEKFWSGYVMAGAACMWILTTVAVMKRRNLLKNTIWEAVLLWGVFLFWDFITGWRGWSVDFGIPCVLMVVFVALWVIVILTKAPVSHYMIYMVMASLGSVVPLILLLCGTVKEKLPSVVCVAGAVLMISALAIFKGRALWDELEKKTHL